MNISLMKLRHPLRRIMKPTPYCGPFLKDYTTHFAYLSLIYSVFIHVTLLTIISQRIKPYFSFPDILQNLLIFQNQIFK
ncbi:hypothetical protein LDENG_00003760 [Lucifuga dentata]|nr:hypothetical protein LDENG_00003760 [Lucifuga dentata]